MSGQVDCESAEVLHLILVFHHPAQHGFDYPAVYRAHSVVVLCNLDESCRWHMLALVINYCQQDFVVGQGIVLRIQRCYFLAT